MGINDHGARPEGVSADPDGLVVTWPDLGAVTLPYRRLRLACRCASCIEELTGRALLDPATVPEDVRPVALKAVGNYALQFEWSDGHSTGIYTFSHLHTLSFGA